MNRAILWLKCIIFSPFWIIYRLCNYKIQKSDLHRWLDVLTVTRYKYDFFSFIKLYALLPEYRSLVLWRANKEWIPCPKQSVHFVTNSKFVGKGLVLQHGFNSILFPKSIGKNVQIWHNVTIGRNGKCLENPIIGNNVKICTGAIIIGNIHIGDNCIIGAGTIVTKSIPANSVVVGNPARIVKTIKNNQII